MRRSEPLVIRITDASGERVENLTTDTDGRASLTTASTLPGPGVVMVESSHGDPVAQRAAQRGQGVPKLPQRLPGHPLDGRGYSLRQRQRNHRGQRCNDPCRGCCGEAVQAGQRLQRELLHGRHEHPLSDPPVSEQVSRYRVHGLDRQFRQLQQLPRRKLQSAPPLTELSPPVAPSRRVQ